MSSLTGIFFGLGHQRAHGPVMGNAVRHKDEQFVLGMKHPKFPGFLALSGDHASA